MIYTEYQYNRNIDCRVAYETKLMMQFPSLHPCNHYNIRNILILYTGGHNPLEHLPRYAYIQRIALQREVTIAYGKNKEVDVEIQRKRLLVHHPDMANYSTFEHQSRTSYLE